MAGDIPLQNLSSEQIDIMLRIREQLVMEMPQWRVSKYDSTTPQLKEEAYEPLRKRLLQGFDDVVKDFRHASKVDKSWVEKEQPKQDKAYYRRHMSAALLIRDVSRMPVLQEAVQHKYPSRSPEEYTALYSKQAELLAGPVIRMAIKACAGMGLIPKERRVLINQELVETLNEVMQSPDRRER